MPALVVLAGPAWADNQSGCRDGASGGGDADIACRRLVVATGTRGRRVTLAFSTGLAAKLVAVLPQIIAVPIVIGSIGVVEFGMFATVSAALAWVTLTSLGLAPGLTQRLAAAHARRDLDQEAELFSSTLAGVTVAVAASSVVLLAVAAPLVVSGHLAGGYLLTAIVLAAAVLLQLQLSPIDAALTGYQELHWINVVAGVASVATIGAVGVVALLAPSAWAFAAALGLTPIAFKAVNGALLFRRRPFLLPSRRRIRAGTAVGLLGVGILFLGVQAGPLFAQQGAIVLSASSLGAEAAATTGLLVRLLILIGAPIVVGTQALWPAVIDARAGHDPRWVRMAMRRTLILACLYALGVAGALVLCGTQLVLVWSAGSVSVDPTLMALVGAAFVVIVWTHVHAIVLLGLGHVAFVSAVSVAEAIIALGLMAALLPAVGLSATWLALACAGVLTSAWIYPLHVALTLRRWETPGESASAGLVAPMESEPDPSINVLT